MLLRGDKCHSPTVSGVKSQLPVSDIFYCIVVDSDLSFNPIVFYSVLNNYCGPTMCQALSYGLELSSNSWARTRQNLLNVSFANLDEISLFVTSQPPLVSLPHSSSPTHTQKVGVSFLTDY